MNLQTKGRSRNIERTSGQKLLKSTSGANGNIKTHGDRTELKVYKRWQAEALNISGRTILKSTKWDKHKHLKRIVATTFRNLQRWQTEILKKLVDNRF